MSKKITDKNLLTSPVDHWDLFYVVDVPTGGGAEISRRVTANNLRSVLDDTISWDRVKGKPSGFSPVSAHTHTISDISNFDLLSQSGTQTATGFKYFKAPTKFQDSVKTEIVNLSNTTGGTLFVDLKVGNVFQINLTTSITLEASPIDGAGHFQFIFVQDSVGGHSVTLAPGQFMTPLGIKPVLTGTANSIDMFAGISLGSRLMLVESHNFKSI